MPLRLLEATVPNEELENIPSLLEDIRIVHLWTSGSTSESTNTTGIVRVLADADHTEALTDLLVDRFGSRDDFRLMLLPVEATLPAVEEPEDDEERAGEEEAEPDKGATQRISREELYEDLGEASRLTRVYVVMVALSTVVAAVGLIRGDVAIIIGAMVIAPLLGPNVALSLAATLGDLHLAKRSFRAMGVGLHRRRRVRGARRRTQDRSIRSGTRGQDPSGDRRHRAGAVRRGRRVLGLHQRCFRRGRGCHGRGSPPASARGRRPARRGGTRGGSPQLR